MGVEQRWYGPKRHALSLWPLQWIFWLLSSVRRVLYRVGFLSRYQASVPVLVVGNINVGGTGKTPVVVTLVQYLQKKGLRVGVVSRGYGAKAPHYPYQVENESLAQHCGDEPLLIKLRTSATVVVDPKRVRAVQVLESQGVDVIISDDGLQHYALSRDLEIAVVDSVRQFGNGWLLPAGPLREPRSRLQNIDFVVVNGAHIPAISPFWFSLAPAQWRALNGSHASKLPIVPTEHTLYAVAGIGHPHRFFRLLNAMGFTPTEYAFPDHHQFIQQDFESMDGSIVMTEKDAVKCRTLALQNAWYVPVDAQLNESFWQAFGPAFSKIQSEKSHG